MPINIFNKTQTYKMYTDCEDYLSSTSTQDDYGTLNVKLKTEFCKYWSEGKPCPFGSRVI